MTDIEKEINELAGDLIIKADNPLIDESVRKIYGYGINAFKNKVIAFLENKVVIKESDIKDMLGELSESIDSMSDTQVTNAYNEGIETAQNIIYKYLHM